METTIYYAVFIFFYFSPTINAYLKKNINVSSIFVANLLLGWTVIGWIVVLIWSEIKTLRRK